MKTLQITSFVLMAAVLPARAIAAESGQEIAETLCSRCHAIGKTGDSAHPDAPPFRTLHRLYPVDTLAEALAEGIVTGHPDMPEFRFEADDADMLIDYLISVQVM